MAYTSSQVVQAVPTGINSALVFIAKTVVTSTTQANLTNVFSSAYDFYTVRWTNLVLGAALNMRYGTSGTPDTATTYRNNGIYSDNANVQVTTYSTSTSSNPLVANRGDTGNSLMIDILNPFLSQITYYFSATMAIRTSDNISGNFLGAKDTSTSYTDLVFLSGSNFSGTVSIYGYTNS